ncbi:MAG: extracellular solute-binding protein [Chloroflexi bacterium]|nr:extracellular solute-binding protein [Chloroflexota bacterium]
MIPRISALLLVIVVSLAVMACQPAAPATLPPAATTPAQKAPSKATGEWDKIVEAGKKEGQVLIYAASIGEAKDTLTRGFKERYGINVEFILGRSAELLARLSTERQAGIYAVDAGLQGLTTYFNQLRPMNVTVNLEPWLILPEVTDPKKWRPGKLNWVDKNRTALTFCATTAPYISINTELVKDEEVASNDGVVNPRWKGKIVINDPTIAGNGAEWFSYIVLASYGREKGEQYMRALAKLDPVITRDQRQQVEWVARGRYAIGLGLTQSEVVKMAGLGAPIKFIKPKEGLPLTSGPMNVMVFDRAPHPNATKVFVNWLLTDEGGRLASQGSGYPSERVGVSNEGFDPITVPGTNDLLPGEEYKLAQGDMIKLAREVFAIK